MVGYIWMLPIYFPELIEEKLETMLLQFLDVGLDIREEPMEVAPTAHHFMGGATHKSAL